MDGGRVDELARRVLQAARDCNVSLATAESCTAGAIAASLSAAPGAAKYFHGGVVAYTKAMKSKLLGVSPALLEEKSAVSAEVAVEMARGVLARSPADIVVTITGVVGPEPDEDGNPVGLIYCAVATRRGGTRAIRLDSKGRKRDAILEEGICAALDLLLAACGEHVITGATSS